MTLRMSFRPKPKALFHSFAMPELVLPDSVKRQISATFAGGAEWLDNLPVLTLLCEKRWSLQLGDLFPALSYSVVMSAASADGNEVVLKLCVPNRELTTEIAALRHYDGRGCVRLIDADADLGAVLLERLHPGHMLTTESDDETATRIAAQVMLQLQQPPPAAHNFPTVADWGRGFGRLRAHFDGGTGPFPQKLVDAAELIFSELVADSAEAILLHGDLHHYNILRAKRAPWLAIDPKGVVGEPAYEVGAYLRNPLNGFFDQPDAQQQMARRVAVFAETLDLERERIIGWGFAQAVLSAWWSVEDGSTAWLGCAEILDTLRRSTT